MGVYYSTSESLVEDYDVLSKDMERYSRVSPFQATHTKHWNGIYVTSKRLPESLAEDYGIFLK